MSIECAAKDAEIAKLKAANETAARHAFEAHCAVLNRAEAAEAALTEANARLELIRNGKVRHQINVHYVEAWNKPRRIEEILWYVKSPDRLYTKLDDALDEAMGDQK